MVTSAHFRAVVVVAAVLALAGAREEEAGLAASLTRHPLRAHPFSSTYLYASLPGRQLASAAGGHAGMRVVVLVGAVDDAAEGRAEAEEGAGADGDSLLAITRQPLAAHPCSSS